MALYRTGSRLLMRNGSLSSTGACCCDKCSGDCSPSSPCQPDCRCYQGDCVPACSGPCTSNAECAPGCWCVDGNCEKRDQAACVPLFDDCGYQSAACDTDAPPDPFLDPCNPELPELPLTGNTACAGGRPTEVLLTFDGFTFNTGDDQADALLNTYVNASYALHLGCFTSGVASLEVPAAGAFAQWQVGLGVVGGNPVRTILLGVSISTPSGYSATVSIALRTPQPPYVPHSCGQLVDCSDFEGAPTTVGSFPFGIVNAANANVRLQGL